MSYCRWSSDSFRCDLYCYESADGFVTHVAGYRVPDDTPVEPWFFDVSPEEFFEAHKKLMDFLDAAERTPIGLEYDGETFCDGDLEDFRERIIMLWAAGYRAPYDGLLLAITEEIAERDAA